MNLAYPVAVVIPCPFLLAMANRGMRAEQMVVTTPLIGMNFCFRLGKLMNVCFQCFSVRMMNQT